MNVVDSSAWRSYFSGDKNAAHFAAAIDDLEQLLMPSIAITEIFKNVPCQRDEESALTAIPNFNQAHRMNTRYTAIIKQQGDWWTGWIAEIAGIHCQELSREALLKSLTFNLREALEQNRDAAIIAAGMDFEEISINV